MSAARLLAAWHRGALALALLLGAPAAGAADEDPVQLMSALEARLIHARHVLIEAQIEARGAIAASLTGRTELFDRNRARAEYHGQFAAAPADLSFEIDSRITQLRSGAAQRAEPTGPEANRALIVGLTRMGLLHDLARLHELKPPDHAAGGADGWIRLDSFRPTTYVLGGDLEGAMSFGFDVVVGNAVSPARVWLDPDSGLPRRRQITVHFPQGDMTVVEDYLRFVVE